MKRLLTLIDKLPPMYRDFEVGDESCLAVKTDRLGLTYIYTRLLPLIETLTELLPYIYVAAILLAVDRHIEGLTKDEAQTNCVPQV